MRNNIRQYRMRKNLSQADLARKLGFTRSYINKVERGKVPIGMKLAVRIANELECQLDDLFFTHDGEQ